MTDALSGSRAYPAISGRQQRIDREVSSVTEIRAALEVAAERRQPANLRLGCDVIITSPITIPSDVPRFQLNGSNAFRILFGAPIAAAVVIEGTATRALVNDVDFEGTTAANICASLLSTTTTCNRLRLRNVGVENTTDLVDPTKTWSRLSAVDMRLAVDAGPAAPMNLRATTDVGALARCVFVNCVGNCSVAITRGSGAVKLVSFNDGFQTTSTLDTSLCVAATANVFLGANFTSSTLRSSDFRIGDENKVSVNPNGLSVGQSALTLNTTNPTLNVLNRSYILLTLGASSLGPIALSDGLFAGHLLVLQCVSNTGLALIQDNTASNVKLSADWIPTADDTLSLIWDASGSNWVELARSAN